MSPGQNIAVANAANPVTVLGLTDTRGLDAIVDGNGLPLDAAGNIQFNELSASIADADVRRNVSTTTYDPAVLNGWGKRGYNTGMDGGGAAPAGRPRVAERRLSTAGRSATRRSPTTCATTRAATTSFCLTAPANPNLPGGGGYQVCGVRT